MFYDNYDFILWQYGDHEEESIQHILEARCTYKNTVKAPDSKLAKLVGN